MAKKNQATTTVAGKGTGQASAAKPEAKKAERKGKPAFPLTASKDPKVYPFQVAMPTGYDPEKYARLKRSDFGSKALYFEYRAQLCELDAKNWRDAAKGGTKSAQKRFKKLQSKLADLRKQLEADGIDADELIAEMAGEADAAE